MITAIERMMIVNDYIGVESGNLNHFSHKSLEEFYPSYCELEIDINLYSGTKKDRFIQILKESDLQSQIKILRGLLAYLPLDKFKYTHPLSDEVVIDESKKVAYSKIESILMRLEGGNVPFQSDLSVTNETVERAIQDAKLLIERNGATSGVDRVHTALQGYLKQVCKESNIPYKQNDSLTQLIGKLRANHDGLKNLGPRGSDIEAILNSLRDVLDKLNPIRNSTSMAHPNENLLAEDEAMFVIDTIHTILNYLSRKFKKTKVNKT